MISVGSLIESHGPYRIPQSPYPNRGTWSTISNHISNSAKLPKISPERFRPNPYVHQHNFQQNMESINPDDMEAFQRLSDQYQPDVQGPLVGEKLPMNVLVREYAQADPRFVAKTEALAATHSAYRPIKGDGQCGWRAAVFGYFEVLLQSCDLHRIEQERARLKSFDVTMRAAGIDVDILEDMFDCSYDLLDRIKAAIDVGDTTENTVLQVMNNESDSSCILYHFKSMTSAFMQLNQNTYEPFLEMSMLQYRQQRIDPSNQEMDDVGLQALTDGVIAPAGIALDVSYLDRSEGDEVTPHRFVPNAAGCPTIRLLYRPGHYDMLYQDLQAGHSNLPMQVNLLSQVDTASDMYYSTQPMQADMFLLTMLSPNESVWQDSVPPGPYQPPQNHSVSMPTSYNNVYSTQYSYTPTATSSPMDPSAVYGQTWSGASTSNIIPATASPISPIMTPSPREEPINEPKIRRNNYSLLVHNHQFPTLDGGLPPGSSSTSHFNDPNFQPEAYRPEAPGKKLSVRQKRGSS